MQVSIIGGRVGWVTELHQEHITPVLRQLHWLPVWQCTEFKIAVLVYNAMNICHHSTWRTTVNSSQPLATRDFDRLMWPLRSCKNSHNTSQGDRSFTAAGSRLWNSLPRHLRDSELSPREFRRLQKMHFFGRWSQRLVTYLDIVCFMNVLTYLHPARKNLCHFSTELLSWKR